MRRCHEEQSAPGSTELSTTTESQIELWVPKSTVDTQMLENTGTSYIYHSLCRIGQNLGCAVVVDSSPLTPPRVRDIPAKFPGHPRFLSSKPKEDKVSRALASQAKPQRESESQGFRIARSWKTPRFFASQANIAGFSRAFFLAFSCNFRSSECVFASLAKTLFCIASGLGVCDSNRIEHRGCIARFGPLSACLIIREGFVMCCRWHARQTAKVKLLSHATWELLSPPTMPASMQYLSKEDRAHAKGVALLKTFCLLSAFSKVPS